MTYRKGEIKPRMNERDYPYIVEVAVPSHGFGQRYDLIAEFHRLRGIQEHRGRTTMRGSEWFCRWCFADAETAEDFRFRFGGVLLQRAAR